VVVRRGQIRRIGWVMNALEAQVGQLLLGCKCPVSCFLPGRAKYLSAHLYCPLVFVYSSKAVSGLKRLVCRLPGTTAAPVKYQACLLFRILVEEVALGLVFFRDLRPTLPKSVSSTNTPQALVHLSPTL
jgi:hypothetical protein